MTFRLKFLSAAILAAVFGIPVQAQGLRLPPAAVAAAATKEPATADFIVAVVNSEPITNTEVQREVQRVLQQLAALQRPQPDRQRLSSDVLERLINQKIQLQLARDTGIRVEESAIDQSELAIAAQNQLDLATLRRRVEADGLSVSQFRSQLRDQISLQRLRERELTPRVRVSELDIDAYLQEQQSAQDASKMNLNLAQILIAVPENAAADQVQDLQARAQKALERARAGEDFALLVRELSEPSAQANGGQLGLRSADRYPDLFVNATREVPQGAFSDVVRSPAGFHVLKVLEKTRAGLPAMAVTQTHARHILLVPSAQQSEAQARSRLLDLKKRLQSGQADFAALAREFSQDGSAAQGGDLGWANPGMFVPEFEQAINQLAPGEVSEPLLSRFGLHLIQLLERRQVSLTQAQQREAVRAQLREKKLDEALRSWLQEQRGRAYVELREPPL
ncbi:MAG: molecular chaperone SurA [Comamonadaceae bacterium CG_4_9_14_3_um_filter_60_33]|nr:MAG: molecular chaperone SurA [Comamonadaceae bacterium CG2_30_59_20]PJB45025.1 MAG: molecular chaperone SurA [Comamonadaceae bacterium CG_4_9_14_3_um_filter_60_33]